MHTQFGHCAPNQNYERVRIPIYTYNSIICYDKEVQSFNELLFIFIGFAKKEIDATNGS